MRRDERQKELAVFEGHEIRRRYDETTEMWWFSVVDIIQALTRQPSYQAARNYWKVLKNRLNKEGSQVVTNCNQLKMTADDGRVDLEEKTGRKVVSSESCLPPAKAVKIIR